MTSPRTPQDLAALAVKARRNNAQITDFVDGVEPYRTDTVPQPTDNARTADHRTVVVLRFPAAGACDGPGRPPKQSMRSSTSIQNSKLNGRVSVLAVDGRSKDAARTRSANSGRCRREADNSAPINRAILDRPSGPSDPNTELMGSPAHTGDEVQVRHSLPTGGNRDDTGQGAGLPGSGAPQPYTGLLANTWNRLGSTPHCPRSLEPSRAVGASAPAALVGGRER